MLPRSRQQEISGQGLELVLDRNPNGKFPERLFEMMPSIPKHLVYLSAEAALKEFRRFAIKTKGEET